MAQVQVLPYNNAHIDPRSGLMTPSVSISIPETSAAHRFSFADDDCLRTSSLPTPPLDEREHVDEYPRPRRDIRISGLPALADGSAQELVRSRILQAALDAELNEPDAERAFFVADLSKVYRQFVRWHQQLPGIEPFYAVKCNPDPYVLRLLAALGANFDCASHGEIQQVIGTGVDPARIIFANPCKSISFVRHAARAGVDYMTFDNVDELHKIVRAGHRNAKLVVRILTDDSKSLCRLGLKFGAPLTSVPVLLAKARELELEVVGVSFHVGSGCYDSSAFDDALSRAKRAFAMGSEAGFKFSFLDIGGGFETETFDKTAAVIRRAMQTYFPDARQEGIRVIAEPGRYFVTEAFQLATNVIARRLNASEDEVSVDTQDEMLDAMEMDGVDLGPSPVSEAVQRSDADQPSVMYYINDGVYGAFNCIMFDHQKPTPYPLTIARSLVSDSSVVVGKQKVASVWGPTCDSIDCVAPLCKLPASLEVGDWLGFDRMGAYTICAASQFNGFKTSAIHYTSGADENESAAVRHALSIFNNLDDEGP